jgi:hypothetical protein
LIGTLTLPCSDLVSLGEAYLSGSQLMPGEVEFCHATKNVRTNVAIRRGARVCEIKSPFKVPVCFLQATHANVEQTDIVLRSRDIARIRGAAKQTIGAIAMLDRGRIVAHVEVAGGQECVYARKQPNVRFLASELQRSITILDRLGPVAESVVGDANMDEDANLQILLLELKTLAKVKSLEGPEQSSGVIQEIEGSRLFEQSLRCHESVSGGFEREPCLPCVRIASSAVTQAHQSLSDQEVNVRLEAGGQALL